METPFIKTEIVGSEPNNFWQKKLHELREQIYRKMETTGACPICGQSVKPHSDDCGFAKIEGEIVEYVRKKKESSNG